MSEKPAEFDAEEFVPQDYIVREEVVGLVREAHAAGLAARFSPTFDKYCAQIRDDAFAAGRDEAELEDIPVACVRCFWGKMPRRSHHNSTKWQHGQPGQCSDCQASDIYERRRKRAEESSDG